MATKKDLVEAYSFSRRRLITAFISGAPGGREVEPSRPGRTIVGGIALAVLLVAGAAVTGVFKSRVDGDWMEEGLVSSKEKTTAYLIIDTPEGEDPVLRPLINTTSAMLLFGADVEGTTVPEEDLKTLDEGDSIGILNAPASPPLDDDLITEGWTACTGLQMGIRVNVSETEATDPAPGTGFLVKSEGAYYVIGEGEPEGGEDPRAYLFPVRVSGKDRLPDTVLSQLTGGSISTDAIEVPPAWVGLFPLGGVLDVKTLGLGQIDKPVDYAGQGGIPDAAKIGNYYVLEDTTYAITEEGPTALSDFAAFLLKGSVSDTKNLLTLSENVTLKLAPSPYDDAHWPIEPLTPSSGELCAELTPDPESPVVRIVENPEEAASAEAAELTPENTDSSVDSGAGIYVRSGQWVNDPGDGEAYLITGETSYILQGTEVPELLGYGSVDPLFAPAEWVELFETGVTLSVNAARCPPANQDEVCE